ncbi:hypothetical protein KCU85_g8097, partial [Aureobasidium melanogenum]
MTSITVTTSDVVSTSESDSTSKSETASSSLTTSASSSPLITVSTTGSSQYTSMSPSSSPSSNTTASTDVASFSNTTSTSAGSTAPSAGFGNVTSSAAESSAGVGKRDLEQRGNVAVSTKKTTSSKKVSSTKKPSTSVKSTSTKKVTTSSRKASTSLKPISTTKKAISSTSPVKTSSIPINKGQPALFNGLNNAQQSSICSCLHVPTPTFTRSIFVDTFTTITSTVTAVQTLVSSTTTTAYHTTTARPDLFYMQVSSKSKTSVDGQWAVLRGELLGFTSGKAGASEFFFAEPNLLVEYQSNFLANVEGGDWATSFYMNSVWKMYNVSAVPLACGNKGGVLSCQSGDLEQLYWCSVWGTTSLVLGPSTYDNGLCKPVSLDIVPA